MVNNLQVENLKRLLSYEGIETQKDFAALLGISTVTVNRWFKGHNAISLEHAKRICEVFPGYDINFVLGFTQHPSEKAEEHLRVFEKAYNEGARGKVVFDIANSNLCSCSVEPIEFEFNDADEEEIAAIPFKGVPFVRVIHEGKEAVMSNEEWYDLAEEVFAYIDMRLTMIAERGAW